MKKICYLLLTILLLSILTGCGQKSIKLDEYVSVVQEGIANHYGTVELVPDWDAIKSNINQNKIVKFCEKNGIENNDLSSIIEFRASRRISLSNGDEIEIVAYPATGKGVNISIDEIEKELGVSFKPFKYTVSNLADLTPISFFKNGIHVTYDGPNDYCTAIVQPGYSEEEVIYQDDNISIVYKGNFHAHIIQNNRVIMTVYYDIETDSQDQTFMHNCGMQGVVSNGDTLTAFLSITQGDGTFGYSSAHKLSSESGSQELASLGYCARVSEQSFTVSDLGELITSKNYDQYKDEVSKFFETKKNSEYKIYGLYTMDKNGNYGEPVYDTYLEYLESNGGKYSGSFFLVAKPSSAVDDVNMILSAVKDSGNNYECELLRNLYISPNNFYGMAILGRMGGYGETNDYLSQEWFSKNEKSLDELMQERYSNDYEIYALD